MLRLAAATLGMALVTGCSGEAPRGGVPESAAPSPRPAVTTPYPSPPADGEVRLVEQGFSVTLSEGRDVRLPKLTYGLVFENTSDVVAAFVQVRIRALDKSGKALKASGTLTGQEQDSTVIRNEILYLLPGERVGIGDAGYMSTHEAARRVARLQVTVAKVEWWAPGNAVWCFTRVRATNVKLVNHRRGAGLLEFDPDVEQGQYFGSLTGDVVFRDKRGRIVGGGWLREVEHGMARIGWGVPLEFDPSKIEFYPRVQQAIGSTCPAG